MQSSQLGFSYYGAISKWYRAACKDSTQALCLAKGQQRSNSRVLKDVTLCSKLVEESFSPMLKYQGYMKKVRIEEGWSAGESGVPENGCWSFETVDCDITRVGGDAALNRRERCCVAFYRSAFSQPVGTQGKSKGLASVCSSSASKRRLAGPTKVICWVCLTIFWQNSDYIEKLGLDTYPGIGFSQPQQRIYEWADRKWASFSDLSSRWKQRLWKYERFKLWRALEISVSVLNASHTWRWKKYRYRQART